MKSRLKYACIGAGGIADKKHLKEYSLRSDIEVIAICDSNIKAAEKLAAKYCVPNIYNNCEEMFEKHNLDLVSVCVPNYMHAQITIAALKKGINVHCEKPLAVDAHEAQEIVDVKNKYQKKVMVALNYRFTSEAQFVKRYAEEGLFGEIYHAKCGWIRRNGIPGKGVWFTDKELSGGGALIDLGVHFLDLSMFFMDYPKVSSVSSANYSKFGGSASRLRPGYRNNGDGKYDVEDMAVGIVRMKNGATIDFEFSWASNIEKESKYFEVLGTKGGACFKDGELQIYSEVFDTNINIKPDLNNSILQINEFENFVNCIQLNKEPYAPPEEAVELMKVIDALYLSNKLGKEVELEKSLQRRTGIYKVKI